jgi:glycosyltransferase involved in cell wall biosynthesis
MAIKLIILVNSLQFGGAERHAIQLANLLPTTYFDVHLVYLKAREELRAELKLDANKVWCANLSGGLDIAGLLRLRRHIKRVNPEIVLCVNTYPLLYAWLAKVLLHRRFALVEVFHSTVLAPAEDRRMRWVYRPLFNAADLLVYVSQAQQRYWNGRGIVARSELVIHNGIDLSRFSEQAVGLSVDDAKARLGIAPDCFTIGLCAVFRPEKAHDDLLQAVAQLKRQGLRCRVLLIGDGPCRPAIESRIAELGLQGEVTITGFQPDVRPYVLACDVMSIVSHRVETFSIAALESMALGKPMVMSDVGGAAEQVVEGKTGFLFPPGDVPALAQALRRVALDPERARMGQMSRARTEKHFQQSHMVARYAAVLAAAVRGPQTA